MVQNPHEMIVEVYGVVDEIVRLGFIDKNLNQIVVECTFVDSGQVKSIPSALIPKKSSMDYMVIKISSDGSCL